MKVKDVRKMNVSEILPPQNLPQSSFIATYSDYRMLYSVIQIRFISKMHYIGKSKTKKSTHYWDLWTF